MYYVYILYSEKFDRYYIGQTQDVGLRLDRHNSGYVPSTKAYIPWELACVVEKPTRSEAMKLEMMLMNLK